jgi:hypothetical protein
MNYMKRVFESFIEYKKRLIKEGGDIGLDFDIDSLDEPVSKPDKIEKDKAPEEIEDEYQDVPRLDKEAYILSKSEKTEEELNDFSDDEINAMYKKFMDDKKVVNDKKVKKIETKTDK